MFTASYNFIHRSITVSAKLCALMGLQDESMLPQEPLVSGVLTAALQPGADC